MPSTTITHRRTQTRPAPSLADGLPPESHHAENSAAEADWIATRIESIPGTYHLGRTGTLTRFALAEKIGSAPATITKILKGETNFTLDSMVNIAISQAFCQNPCLRPVTKREMGSVCKS